MQTQTFSIRTGQRRLLDVTDVARRFASEHGGDGLLHAFLPHATAGLALIETGAGSDDDLLDALDRLLPRDDRYQHRHGSPGHGADHVMPGFVSPSISVPVSGGQLLLGTWQSLVVVDLNVDNPDRTLRLSFLSG